MKGILLVLGLFLLSSFSLQQHLTPSQKRYDGYSLIQAEAKTEKIEEILQRFPEIQEWSRTEGKYDLLVPPSLLPLVSSHLSSLSVLQEDIQKEIENQFTVPRQKWVGVGTKDGFFDTFRTYAEYEVFIDELIAAHPRILSKYVSGETIEGRKIYTVKLSTGGSKPGIYIEATAHAREWLAPPTALFSLVQLVENYQKRLPTEVKLVEELEWHFNVILNIDGYIYTWERDRFWRKNRRNNVGSSFYGVDINRNFGPNNTWCTAGSSRAPSSDTYCGTSAFSEPETQASAFTASSISQLGGVIAFHTYGPLLLHPFQYSYSSAPEPYNSEVVNLGKKMESAINAVHKERYRSIQGSDLYPHSGGTIDWAYFEKGVPAFTVEIRGNSFVVPDSQIILAGEENYQGVLVMAQHVLDKASS